MKKVHGPTFAIFMVAYILSSFGWLFAYALVFTDGFARYGYLTIGNATFDYVGLIGYLMVSGVFGVLWWWLSRG